MDEKREYATSIEQRIKIMELAVELINGTRGGKAFISENLSKKLQNVYTTMYDLINPPTNQDKE